MWLSRTGIVLLFLYVNPNNAARDPDTIIKDAIVSLAHIIRDNTQRLERHEARELQLGEQLKKAVFALAKKGCSSEVIDKRFLSMDERIAGIENLISQKDERERIQIEKTMIAIDNLDRRLENWFAEIGDSISEVNRNFEPNNPSGSSSDDQEEKVPTIYTEIQSFSARLSSIERTLEQLDNSSSKSSTCENSLEESAKVRSIVSKVLDTETQLLERVESIKNDVESIAGTNKNTTAFQEDNIRLVRDIDAKLSQVGNSLEEIREPNAEETELLKEIVSKLNETEKRIDEMANDSLRVTSIESQVLANVSTNVEDANGKLKDLESSIGNIRQSLSQLESKSACDVHEESTSNAELSQQIESIRQLVEKKTDEDAVHAAMARLQTLHNETLSSLQETRHVLENIINGGFNAMNGRGIENREELKNIIATLRRDLATNADYVNGELVILAKGKSLVESTADQILDTKKKVEYGVRQILWKVDELIEAQRIAIDKTFSQRFDVVGKNITTSHGLAIGNLTAKMEDEMKQIWRQINVMYRQMTVSTAVIEKLRQQNEGYVNGTSATIDGMEGKLSDINVHIDKVQQNLNFLLGRLSLVTHEFDRVKTQLTTVLDGIRESFTEIRNRKVEDPTNEGPRAIPDDQRELDEKTNVKHDITNSIA